MPTTFPLIRSKLQPPVLRGQTVPRAVARRLALAIDRYRATLICAPAGYGKSTLAAAAAAPRPDRLLAWYAADAAEQDVHLFLAYLLGAVETAAPGLADEAWRILNHHEDPQRGHLLVTAALLEAMADGLRRPLVLVIDDVHTVADSPPVAEVVGLLSERLPPDVHLCLISRRQMPFARLARLLTHRELLLIGTDDLVFDRAEVRRFLQQRLGIAEPDESMVTHLLQLTEGWAAGLELAAHLTAAGKTGAAVPREQLFAYFAGEVLASQPPALYRFLLHSSVLPYLQADLCRAVLGDAGPELLPSVLAGQGFFVQALDEQAGIYRYHHLFAEFLQTRLLAEYGEAVHQDLHQKAAAYFCTRGDFDQALEHYRRAGDRDRMAELVKQTGQQWLRLGRLSRLQHWLELLPPAQVQADPWLLYYQGAALQHVDFGRSLELLEQAIEGFVAAGNVQGQVRSLILMITQYTLQNRVDKVQETGARIPVLASLLGDRWSRGVVLVAALGQAAWEDRLRRGLWLSRATRAVYLEDDWRWARQAYTCMIQYRLGNLVAARQLMAEALTWPVVQGNDHWAALANILLAVSCVVQGDHAATAGPNTEVARLGERYHNPYYKAYAQRHVALMAYRNGQFTEARDAFLASLHFFNEAGNQAMAAVSRADLAMLRACLGDAAAALPEAEAALAELRSTNAGQGLADFVLSITGAIAREAGEPARAEQYLLQAARISEQKGARHVLAGTHLHLAALYLQLGKPALADRYLTRALGAASLGAYDSFWDFHAPTIGATCQRALAQGIYPEHAARLLRLWCPEHAPAERREQPPVAVRTLGAFAVTVGGVAVPDSAWRTRKVKGVFKYLLAGGSRPVRREELAAVFWPDADRESAAASLRVALSQLRQVLGQAADLLCQEQDRLWLSPHYPLSIDDEHFATLVQDALARTPAESDPAAAALAEAAAAYTGDYLEEDAYSDWPQPRRERLRNLYVAALLRLARLALDRRDDQAAIAHAEQALAADRLNEEALHLLIEAHAAAGRRAKALAVAAAAEALLQQELGVGLGPRTQALCDLLRQGPAVKN